MLHSKLGWETVLRGGVGVFFDTAQQLGGFASLRTGFYGLNIVPALSFPDLCAVSCYCESACRPILRSLSLCPAPAAPLYPSMEHQLRAGPRKSQSLTVSYVGSHGARLLKQAIFYAPTTRTLTKLNS